MQSKSNLVCHTRWRLEYTIPNRIRWSPKKLGEEMIQDGIHFIVGPITSEEMLALEDDATKSDTILIGFGSTTPGISSQENTIVRLCPNDTIQALALQGLFNKTNITTIIPVVRDDIYGQNLYGLLANLSENGNFSLSEPIFYEPSSSSFNKTIETVTTSVRTTGLKQGVGVLIVGFNEASDILKEASQNTDLDTLSWFGTDGIALTEIIPKNQDIAEFAAKTNFTATIYGELENEAPFKEYSKRLQDAAGMKPNSYAIVIYDAVQLAVMTDIMSQGNQHKRAIFVDNANHFYGVSGYTSLTLTGDRKYANIDYWRIKENDGSYSWSKIGRYINQMIGPIIEVRK
ncbi:MAG: ABC transporter substrate-binding protein [Methanobacteriota archaeon]